MMGHGIRVMIVLLVLALLAGVAGPTAAQTKTKIAFIYVGPVGDAGWTFQHDNARKSLAEALAAETAYVGARPCRRHEKVTS